jgi:hypothetical protein
MTQRKHGRRQTFRNQSRPRRKGRTNHQAQAKARSLGPRLPRQYTRAATALTWIQSPGKRPACANSAKQNTENSTPSRRTRVPARAQRQSAANLARDAIALSHHALSRERHLIRPLLIDSACRQFPFPPRHVTTDKSSGTSPNIFRITASSNSPTLESSSREKATAPSFASLQDIACARRIAAAAWWHSTASPGANPPSKRVNGNAT